MAGHDIIVVGASAGGVEALITLAAGLPANLPAAVFVVLHVSPAGPSMLPQILSRRGPLPALHPVDGEPIEHGRIYVAPPDYHLLVHHDRVRVTHGPRENGHRPAVDTLFRTAALAYGPRVVGVVLSGTLDDGTEGLRVIKRQDGMAVVQEPDDALFGDMPRSALENVAVDYCLSMSDIPLLLTTLAHTPVVAENAPPVPKALKTEAEMAELEPGAMQSYERPGIPSGFTCPECHGALWDLRDEGLLRFRCRVGHAFTGNSLLAEHSASLEAALWSALRALEEKATLSHRLLERSRDMGRTMSAQRFEEQEQDARGHAEVIRQVLLANRNANGDERASYGTAAEASSSEESAS